MSAAPSQVSRDDVLDAFSVEPSHDRETLELYLTRYPQFASELVDLSRELSRIIVEDEGLLSEEEERFIEEALESHRAAVLGNVVSPIAGLDTPRLRQIAQELRIPRQVITAFRERKIVLSSVPRKFLGQFASTLGVAIDNLVAGLSVGAVPAGMRSYKADGQPGSDSVATFEQILIEAGVEGEQLEALMAEAD
jgi:alkylation response protein AidB-like acyl-CoA dehydrogenase